MAMLPTSERVTLHLALNDQIDDETLLVKVTIVVAASSSWTLYGAAQGAASMGWAAASALSSYVPSITKKAVAVEERPSLHPPTDEVKVEDKDKEEEDLLLLDMADVLGLGTSGQGSAQEYLPDSNVSHSSGMRLRFESAPTCSEEEQMRRQGGSCNECRASFLGPLTTNQRLCHYTGSLYCNNCLKTGHLSIIPASVVFSWDFTPRPVCSSAYEFLTSIKEQPMINIISLNVALLEKIPLLAQLSRMRKSILANIAKVNRDLAGPGEEMTAVAALRREAGETKAYLLQTEAQDFWSLSHLIEIHAESSASAIQQLSALVYAPNSLPRWLVRINADTAAMCRNL